MAASSPRRARKQRARARRSRIAALGLLVAGAALAGCGSGGGAAASSAAANSKQLVISSSALTSGGALPALYTCSGRDISPPLQWTRVPVGTAELALFLLDLGHTESAGGGGGALEAKVTVAWSLRGLSPRLTGLAAGRLPAGAVVGHGRYSICPPKGGTGEYMFRLYALPSRLSAPPSLSDLELFRRANRANSAAGDLISSYTRQ
jgi:phosphatidylethanolamine-binding protein (PEBP) family uncharacterized protein